MHEKVEMGKKKTTGEGNLEEGSIITRMTLSKYLTRGRASGDF